MFNYNRSIFDWFKDDALKLIYEHDLDENSLVVDIGGFTGTWSKKIIEKYNYSMIIYEPEHENFIKQNRNFSEFNNGAGERISDMIYKNILS